MARTFRTLSAVAALLALTACTVHKQADAPALTGPSENATSMTITVTPDVLSQDGQSQSLVQVTAYGPNGQPARSLPLRADIVVGNAATDFGTLSARNIVTDASGRASVTYTAPPPPAINVDTGTVVSIQLTPTATGDFANTTPRVATIRLVPPGTVGAPRSTLTPDFIIPTATVGTTALFQATVIDSNGADATGQIASYVWDFGDGATANGRSASHTYTKAGSFPVTLTITDTLGRTNRTTHATTVGQGQNPTASFTSSPSAPNIGQAVSFNAAASTAESGHKIVSYNWNFGDGATGSGQTVSHTYDQAGSYTVTLQTVDDVGRTSVASTNPVSVGQGNPTSTFTFAPTQPSTNQTVTFDASLSRAASGRSISSYVWAFDDGATATGTTVTHAYGTAGTYSVRLTVTDSAGQAATSTQNVIVSSGTTPPPPTPAYTFSPSQPAPNQSVAFDASSSRAANGRTITNYAWNFDDGTTGTGAQVSHVFTAPRTYNVRLTLTDDAGQSASTTQNVVVASAAPTAKFTFLPATPDVGQTVSFDASQSTAGTGRSLQTYSWNFGDGTTGSGRQVTHVYNTAATYTVILTVTDDVGQTATTSNSVPVTSGTGTAVFTYTPSSPAPAGTTFTFDASTSRADSNATINRYQWQFDGTPDATTKVCGNGSVGGPVYTSSTATITHQYNSPGTFCAVLTVFDNNGKTYQTSRPITIQ